MLIFKEISKKRRKYIFLKETTKIPANGFKRRLIYDIFPPVQEKISYWVKALRLFLKTSKYAGILIVIAIVICGGLIVRALSPKTQTVAIYSNECKGSWQNPQNAKGPPEVGPLADFNSFSEANSAVYQGGSLSLVCQDFETNGELNNTQFLSAKIKFSFTIGENEQEEKIQPPEDGPLSTTTPLIETVTQPTEGVQEIFSDLDTKIIIWYSLDGETWWELDTISPSPLSNALNSGYFSYDAPFLKNWEDVKNLKIKFVGVIEGETNTIAYLDSLWVEATYEQQETRDKQHEIEPKKLLKIRIKDNSLVIPQLKKGFSSDEEPSFIVTESELTIEELIATGKAEFIEETPKIQEENFFEKIKEKIKRKFLEEVEAKENKIRVQIFGPDRNKLDISPEIYSFLENRKEAFEIKIPKPKREFKPGLYKLEIEFETKEAIFLIEQEFSWGVLAINTNKSIYLPGERAYLQIAVLRDDGHTICDANLKLEIISPSGDPVSFEVQRSGKCGANNVTDVPDYFAYYQTGSPGTYQMRLKNLDSDYEITNSFEVRDSVPFDIERIGPTRIYPPATYEMTLKIKINQDFIGEIIETTPEPFEIKESGSPPAQIRKVNGVKEIVWQVDWKRRESYELSYQFDAPDISPYLYLLGPLEIGRLQEIRQWQVAADSPEDYTQSCDSCPSGNCDPGVPCGTAAHCRTCPQPTCPAALENSTLSSNTCSCSMSSGCSCMDLGQGLVCLGSPGTCSYASGTCSYDCDDGYVWDGEACASEGITVSGHAYDDEGVDAIDGSGTNKTVDLRVNGAGTNTDEITTSDGAWEITGVSTNSGDIITVYLDDETEEATTVYVSDGTAQTDVDLYKNRVIVRADTGSITNANLATGDDGDDDIKYSVSGSDLTVDDGFELHVWDGDTFAPGGQIATSPASDQTTTDGDIHIDGTATLTAGGAISCGGDFNNEGTFTHSNNGITFTGTDSSPVFTITDGGENFYSVTFNGSGGEWQFADSTILDNNMTVTAGTLSGTGNITVNGGGITGDGTITFTSGTVTLDAAGNFGGDTAWTFYDLTFGDGADATTSTKIGTGDITVSCVLTIAASQTLDAGDDTWTLSGSGTPFVKTGIFTANSSTFNYTATAATTLAATTYYNLGVGTTADSSAVNFTLGGNTTVSNVLTVGNASSTATDTLAGSSYTLTLSGSGTPFNITSQGTFSAGTSTVKYTGTAATNITATTYSNLELVPPIATLKPDATTNEAYGGSATNSASAYTSPDDATTELTSSEYSDVQDNDTSYLSTTANATQAMKWANVAHKFTFDTSDYSNITDITVKWKGYRSGDNPGIEELQVYKATAWEDWQTSIPTGETAYEKSLGDGSDYFYSTTWIRFGAYMNNVCFDEGVTITLKTNYAWLEVTYSPTYTLGTAASQTITTSGYLTIGDGTNPVTVTAATYDPDLNIDSNLTIAANTTLTASDSGSASFTVAGDWSNSGTFTHSSGTVTFDASSGTKTIDSGGDAFNNIVFNDGGGTATFRPTTALDIDGTFALTGGAFDLDTNDPTVNIAGNITLDGGSITKGSGNVTFDGDLTYDDNVGSVNFGNIYIGTSPATTNLASDLTCDSLTINSGDVLDTNGYNIDSAGDIDIDGTLDATHNGGGNSTIYIGNEWDATGGTFTADTSTVVFDATATGKTITDGGSDWNNVTFNGSGGGWSFADSTVLAGDLTVTAGTLSGTNNIAVSGGDITGTDGSINFTGGTTSLSGAGNLGPTGTGTYTFYNLTLSGSAATTTLAGAITVSNDISIGTDRILALNDKDLTVNGGDITTTTTGSITCSGCTAGTMTLSGAGTVGGGTGSITFYNLTLSGSTATTTLGTAITILNDISIGADRTLDVSASDYAINVGGNWSNSGTFTAQNGTLTFDGSASQSIASGSSSFYNLTITNASTNGITFTDNCTVTTFTATTASTKLTFNAGSTYAFTNISLDGQATGTKIVMQSSSGGTAWLFNITGTQSVSYVDAKDSNASGGDIIDATDGTNADSGGNTNWNFSTPSITSVSDSPDPQQGGSDVSFTSVSSDSDGDNIKLYVCNDSSCTNCSPSDTSNCFAVTTTGTSSNPSVSYSCPSCTLATNNYWAKVCDIYNNCSSIVSGGSFTCKKENSCSETTAANCFSGYAVDGYCCDSACTGTCQRCDATPGICTFRSADDNTECSACNYCDGTNASCQAQTEETGYLCTDDCYDCVSGTCTAMTENDDGSCNADCNSCVSGICTFRSADDNVECGSSYRCDGTNTTCQFIPRGGAPLPPASVTGRGNVTENLGGQVRYTFESGQIVKVVFPPYSIKGTAVVKIEPQNKTEIIKTKPLPKRTQIIGDLIADFEAFSGGGKMESFEKEVQITFTYSDSQVKETEVKEDTLQIYFWDKSKENWQPLSSSEVNTIGNNITAPTNRFSTSFAVMGKKPIIVVPEIVKRISKKIKETVEEISEEISEIGKKIAKLFKPKPPTPPLPPVPPVIPGRVPLVFRGEWQLIPAKPIYEFVLAPLPRAISTLVRKFPKLEETFSQVGIGKITDIGKLEGVKLTLPGLTKRVGLIVPTGIPIAKLSSEAKKKIPTDIVFTKTGGEKIDFNIALTITEEGKPQQRIRTISGKPLSLAIKPDEPVKSIRGFVVFKARKPASSSFQFHLASLIDSLFFANPVFAFPRKEPVEVEERLVLIEFEYTDPDGDGIYTAKIQAPIVEGEYEIITVMDYEDPALGMKEIRLITAVDPEGYIFEKYRGKELRIAGAIASIYWLNSETGEYELWPAEEFLQENPQITDVTGKYSFLVPPGSYYLKVEAPAYPTYQGETFQVKEGMGIHYNIELKAKHWWLRIVDWRIAALILFITILLYKIYRDKIKEKLIKKKYE